jgi:hypothetical protein
MIQEWGRMDSDYMMLLWERFYASNTETHELKDIQKLLLAIEQYIIILSSNTYSPVQNKKELAAMYKVLISMYNNIVSKHEMKINNNIKRGEA